MNLLVDHRWTGRHGIGRFADEIIRRLPGARKLPTDRAPLHPLNALMVARILQRERPEVYFTPGFNPPRSSPVPFVFCVHDLIHLHCPAESTLAKRLYYRAIIKPAGRNASRVLTVSEFSRAALLNWAGWPADRVAVVGNGVGAPFSTDGPVDQPGYPYLLHVGSHRPHRNIPHLIRAFAQSRIDRGIRLRFIVEPVDSTQRQIESLGLDDRVVFNSHLDDAHLAAAYRGALALVLPSTHEGFGLPAIEAMACGTPVACASVSAIPEIVGEAAVLFDPAQIDSIALGIESVTNDSSRRLVLRRMGLERATRFSWEKTAKFVHQALREAI